MGRKTKQKIPLPALFILALVLTAGCAQQNAGTPSGLVITKFLPDKKDIDATGVDTIELSLEVQNNGDSKAQNVLVELYNYGGFLGVTSANLGDIPTATGNPPPQGMKPDNVQDYVFALTVPKRSLGLTENVEFGVRATYDYTSKGLATAYVVPKAEWKVKQQLGAQGVQQQTQRTTGPIAVSISAKDPIVVEKNQNSFTLRVELDNIGTGVVRSDRNGLGVVDAVDLIVPPGLVKGDYCDFTGDLTGNGATLTLQNSLRLKLEQGKHKTLVCRLKVVDYTKENSYNFEATANYRYLTDAFASVTLLGTE